MPTDGISLVSFLDQNPALNYLKNLCVPPVGHSDIQIISDWNSAKYASGAATLNAGKPNIQPIPASEQLYIDSITSTPWFQQAFAGQSVRFGLVEIDKLLAFQYHIDIDRHKHHSIALNSSIVIGDLLKVCLPQAPLPEKFTYRQNSN